MVVAKVPMSLRPIEKIDQTLSFIHHHHQLGRLVRKLALLGTPFRLVQLHIPGAKCSRPTSFRGLPQSCRIPSLSGYTHFGVHSYTLNSPRNLLSGPVSILSHYDLGHQGRDKIITSAVFHFACKWILAPHLLILDWQTPSAATCTHGEVEELRLLKTDLASTISSRPGSCRTGSVFRRPRCNRCPLKTLNRKPSTQKSLHMCCIRWSTCVFPRDTSESDRRPALERAETALDNQRKSLLDVAVPVPRQLLTPSRILFFELSPLQPIVSRESGVERIPSGSVSKP
ncbi:hypothetical protein FB45DRAFT_43143 [Roridomyces roridus]|uniref:Uncharacterized protein n=1 Tax=Roridomyces roridus TaxID=1738132 RepID=A0AAD7FMT9_9AGAR|nr:hypothetical protein FB45DRAFT_43143 [Roridomyces roridus]